MKRSLMILACIIVTVGFLGCGKASENQESSKPVIGISMPTKEQPIWAAYGVRLVEAFENAGYKTIIEFAEDVPERQISQLENMITRGAKYLVIAAVDTYSLTDICQKAKEADIKVLSCDRLIMNTTNVDYYVTFDLIRMGELLGEAIERGLKLKEGAAGPFTLEIFSGSPDDSNSVPFYEGAMNILRKYLDNGTLVVRSGQVDLSVNGILK
jgi:putative multiple sugar transport system substrate-binding protein